MAPSWFQGLFPPHYVVVHEMVHLPEASHNARFKALMSRYMPNWNVHRRMLNRLPVRHEEWDY